MSTYVLFPGFWLGGWAWDEVAARLRAEGHDVIALTPAGVAEPDVAPGPWHPGPFVPLTVIVELPVGVVPVVEMLREVVRGLLPEPVV